MKSSIVSLPACILILFFSCSVKGQDWQTLYNKVNSHYNNQTYHEGIKLHSHLVDLAEKEFGKEHENYGATLSLLGHLYNLTLDYPTAEKLYKEAHEIFKKISGENSIQYANSAINLANVWKAQGKYHLAEPLFISALKVYKSSYGEGNEYAGYSYYLGQLYELEGKYEEAEEVYKKASEIYKKLYGWETENYANSLFALAQLYEKAVKYSEAEKIYKEALEIYQSILGESHPYYFSALNYLAHLYDLKGDYTEAEKLYLQSLDLCKKNLGERHEYYASILNNLANLCKNMGRYHESETYYNKVSEIYKSLLGENHSHYATSLNNLAILYTEYGKIIEAERHYLKASEIYRNMHGEMHPYYATALINLGQLHYKVGNYSMSEEFYSKSKEIFKKTLGEKHPDYANALNGLGMIYQDIGDLDKAESLFLQSMEIHKTSLGNNHPKTAFSISSLCTVYELKGDEEKAEKYYYQLNLNHRNQIHLYFDFLSEKEKESFIETINYSFKRFNSFAIKRYRKNKEIVKEMYNNQLLNKALLLNSSHQIRNAILSSGNHELIHQYKQWKSKKELLGKTFNLSLVEIKQKGIDPDQLVTEINELEKKLASASGAFASNQKNHLSWKNIEASLKSDEAVIEVIRLQVFDREWTDSVCYAFIILKKGKEPELEVLSNGNDLEKKLYTIYKNSIIAKIEDNESYNHYWQPLSSRIRGLTKIYFSSDGIYNKINPLTLKNPETNHYLLDELDIRFITNSKDIISQKCSNLSANKTGNMAVLMGDPEFYKKSSHSDIQQHSSNNSSKLSKPLKDSLNRFFHGVSIQDLEGTKNEVVQIDSILKRHNIKTELFFRENANEEVLKKKENPKILHIATHGYFLQDEDIEGLNERGFAGIDSVNLSENPLLRSGLLLAGAQNTLTENTISKYEDGMLTAYEAMNLHLYQTDLVVLSACETGLGEIKNGEGVYGLQRSFQAAGAKHVIMSLWKVNDFATQKLMVNFYQKWFSTDNIHEALKQAQKELMKEYKHPYYWGAFILTGI